ncbi:MAG: PilZ domain-containing protein [Planctomycetia bacterium]|nr:PilZ domain-containing protein [Planctomycetia bacterium]
MYETPAGAVVEPVVQERRGCVRYICERKGQCQPITVLEAGNQWPMQTLDISASGVSVVLCRRFEPGTLLAIDICDPTQEPMTMPLARVRHVEANGPSWQLGCAWAEALEGSDLRSLLGTPTDWQRV